LKMHHGTRPNLRLAAQ